MELVWAHCLKMTFPCLGPCCLVNCVHVSPAAHESLLDGDPVLLTFRFHVASSALQLSKHVLNDECPPSYKPETDTHGSVYVPKELNLITDWLSIYLEGIYYICRGGGGGHVERRSAFSPIIFFKLISAPFTKQLQINMKLKKRKKIPQSHVIVRKQENLQLLRLEASLV